MISGGITVNGIMNAVPGSIAVASATATPATINGSGNINLTVNRNLLNIPADKGLILDWSVTLNGIDREGSDNDNNALLMVVRGAFEIKGNAMVKGNSNGNGTTAGGTCVSGEILIMSGGEVSGNYCDVGAGGVKITDGGIFTMTGNKVTGNIVFNGAQVRCGSQAKLSPCRGIVPYLILLHGSKTMTECLYTVGHSPWQRAPSYRAI
ncbi:MAG: hypothetical protein MdMp014T_0930 [Treponematales bacterium]